MKIKLTMNKPKLEEVPHKSSTYRCVRGSNSELLTLCVALRRLEDDGFNLSENSLSLSLSDTDSILQQGEQSDSSTPSKPERVSPIRYTTSPSLARENKNNDVDSALSFDEDELDYEKFDDELETELLHSASESDESDKSNQQFDNIENNVRDGVDCRLKVLPPEADDRKLEVPSLSEKDSAQSNALVEVSDEDSVSSEESEISDNRQQCLRHKQLDSVEYPSDESQGFVSELPCGSPADERDDNKPSCAHRVKLSPLSKSETGFGVFDDFVIPGPVKKLKPDECLPPTVDDDSVSITVGENDLLMLLKPPSEQMSPQRPAIFQFLEKRCGAKLSTAQEKIGTVSRAAISRKAVSSESTTTQPLASSSRKIKRSPKRSASVSNGASSDAANGQQTCSTGTRVVTTDANSAATTTTSKNTSRLEVAKSAINAADNENQVYVLNEVEDVDNDDADRHWNRRKLKGHQDGRDNRQSDSSGRERSIVNGKDATSKTCHKKRKHSPSPSPSTSSSSSHSRRVPTSVRALNIFPPYTKKRAVVENIGNDVPYGKSRKRSRDSSPQVNNSVDRDTEKRVRNNSMVRNNSAESGYHSNSGVDERTPPTKVLTSAWDPQCPDYLHAGLPINQGNIPPRPSHLNSAILPPAHSSRDLYEEVKRHVHLVIGEWAIPGKCGRWNCNFPIRCPYRHKGHVTREMSSEERFFLFKEEQDVFEQRKIFYAEVGRGNTVIEFEMVHTVIRKLFRMNPMYAVEMFPFLRVVRSRDISLLMDLLCSNVSRHKAIYPEMLSYILTLKELLVKDQRQIVLDLLKRYRMPIETAMDFRQWMGSCIEMKNAVGIEANNLTVSVTNIGYPRVNPPQTHYNNQHHPELSNVGRQNVNQFHQPPELTSPNNIPFHHKVWHNQPPGISGNYLEDSRFNEHVQVSNPNFVPSYNDPQFRLKASLQYNLDGRPRNESVFQQSPSFHRHSSDLPPPPPPYPPPANHRQASHRSSSVENSSLSESSFNYSFHREEFIQKGDDLLEQMRQSVIKNRYEQVAGIFLRHFQDKRWNEHHVEKLIGQDVCTFIERFPKFVQEIYRCLDWEPGLSSDSMSVTENVELILGFTGMRFFFLAYDGGFFSDAYALYQILFELKLDVFKDRKFFDTPLRNPPVGQVSLLLRVVHMFAKLEGEDIPNPVTFLEEHDWFRDNLSTPEDNLFRLIVLCDVFGGFLKSGDENNLANASNVVKCIISTFSQSSTEDCEYFREEIDIEGLIRQLTLWYANTNRLDEALEIMIFLQSSCVKFESPIVWRMFVHYAKSVEVYRWACGHGVYVAQRIAKRCVILRSYFTVVEMGVIIRDYLLAFRKYWNERVENEGMTSNEELFISIQFTEFDNESDSSCQLLEIPVHHSDVYDRLVAAGTDIVQPPVNIVKHHNYAQSSMYCLTVDSLLKFLRHGKSRCK